MALLVIDGLSFDVKVEVRRTARIESSEISGDMLDLSYFNDVKGTFYDYDVTLKYPLYDRDKYTSLYEALTAPVDGHRFILPYNHSTVDVTARVESVPDQWVERDNGRTFWQALQFTARANHPTRVNTLGEAITRGRTPLPDIASATIGDTYTMTVNGWQRTEFEDGDSIYY